MFSVVIPLYNKEQTVERAIRSVLNQTLQDFEIVVVDDCSTDGGPCVVEEVRDPRICLIHQKNQGVSAARNRGIAEARSALVAFLDADDEWKPAFLQTVLGLVHRFPEAAVFATSYLFSQGGRTWAPRFRGISTGPWEGILTDYFGVAARSDPPISSSAVAVKRNAILGVGGFPVGVTSGEDLLTWARLAVKHSIAFSSQPLSLFHLGTNHCASHLRRQPDTNDVVGTELHRLLTVTTGWQKRSLRLYAALWNKMRASVTLTAGMKYCALRHALRAAALDPLNWRNYSLIVFSLLPSGIGRLLFVHLLDIRYRYRNR